MHYFRKGGAALIMKRQKKRHYLDISEGTNVLFNIILIILSILAVVPFIFVVIISFSDEASIVSKGYSFVPERWSLYAYKYILENGADILHSYGISLIITIVGTLIGLALIATYAYVISRSTYPYKNFFTIVALIPMLFSGGLVGNYLVVARLLNLKNSIWVLILPLAMSPFYVFVLKSFYRTSIPDAIIESARIDGASELRTFLSIVLPISKAGLATIGLFLTLGYWNDWYNAMLYIDEQALIPIQYMLIRIENNINFLSQLSSQQGIVSEVTRNLPSETVRMAIVVLTVTPIACVYPFFQKYFVGGLTLGAVKE